MNKHDFAIFLEKKKSKERVEKEQKNKKQEYGRWRVGSARGQR